MTLKHYCPLMSSGAVAAGNNRLVDCMGSLCELWVKPLTYSEKEIGRCGLAACARRGFTFHLDPAAQEKDDDA